MNIHSTPYKRQNSTLKTQKTCSGQIFTHIPTCSLFLAMASYFRKPIQISHVIKIFDHIHMIHIFGHWICIIFITLHINNLQYSILNIMSFISFHILCPHAFYPLIMFFQFQNLILSF